jgi:hypothetical protein
MGALDGDLGGNDNGREDSMGSSGGSRVGLGTVGCRAGGFGGSRSGAGGLLEGPASYPISGMTRRPVKGLVYGWLSTTQNCCGSGKLGLVRWAVIGYKSWKWLVHQLFPV